MGTRRLALVAALVAAAPEHVLNASHDRPVIPSPAELAKLPPDGGPRWNRLVFEKSAYLLQHASNPVDWYPWGEEAFARAKAQDKPIFLSVGYATCHWCHVMERESFEDPAVAKLLNDDFVCIKVDREERPDVDGHYMSVTQALTGQGGWPMTVFLTPDRKPFHAGTYFPRESRFGRPGMLELVPALAQVWRASRSRVLETAEQVLAHVAASVAAEAGGDLGREALDAAFRELGQRYDPVHGGFGRAPKFPTPHQLAFLLRHAERSGQGLPRDMALTTLKAMRRGGIWDHVGFGFARYSTDREWLLPHFEKMLHDQALMAFAYLDAYQVTGDESLAGTAREIFAYVRRDMTSPEGAFFSAEDADSEGVEGKFYLWTPDELRRVLGEGDADLAIAVFGVVDGGNFREQSTGTTTGESILHLPVTLAERAKGLGTTESALRTRLESVRERLLAARSRRPRPLLDDKVLADWNGLMIAALARGAQVLGEPELARAAARAADFVLTRVARPDGRLLKRWRAGQAGLPAVLDDYAFMTWGLIELYEATFEPRWLEEALRLEAIAHEHHWDPADGGYFLTADDGEKLPVRAKEIYDGAIPSGNAVQALNLLRLARLTARTDLEARVHALVRAFSGTVARSPSAHCQLMIAVDFALGPTNEVVITGDPGLADTEAMLAAVRGRFLPRAVVVLRPDGADLARLVKLVPYVAGQAPLGGKATAYVCRDFACAAPTTDPKKALELLRD